MATPVIIVDPETGREARVHDSRGLSIADPKISESFNATLGTDDTAVEIVPGKNGVAFYVTAILLTGNNNISATVDATVDIYTSTTSASATAETTLIQVPIARSAQTVLTNIFLGTEEGYFINGKTSDDDVFVTIFGFYKD